MKFTQPNDDATNDLNLDAANSSYATDTNAWKVTFSRKMDTADEKDAKIVCGENPISFAIGADQENSKHSAAPTSSKVIIILFVFGNTFIFYLIKIIILFIINRSLLLEKLMDVLPLMTLVPVF